MLNAGCGDECSARVDAAAGDPTGAREIARTRLGGLRPLRQSLKPRKTGTCPRSRSPSCTTIHSMFARGYGVLEKGKPTRADEHSRFAIGSTTKAMTPASLAMLVDEGKLHWDDHVIDYIPELQLYDAYVTRELTIRDLLTRTRTGMGNTDSPVGSQLRLHGCPR